MEMATTLTLTPRGEEYIREMKKDPEFRALCERMAEALKTMPKDRKGLVEACYGDPPKPKPVPTRRDKWESVRV